MLETFSVKNFMNFKDEMIFDLRSKNNYEFNQDCVNQEPSIPVIKTSIVYGINGSGKTNLGLALFDIIMTLTDKEKSIHLYRQYTNLESENSEAVFSYKFLFGEDSVQYNYRKVDSQTLTYEQLFINDELVINYDHQEHLGNVHLPGAENLNSDLSEQNISFVKYINSNTVLSDDKKNRIFRRFMSFVDRMLIFSSLEINHYQGFKVGSEDIPSSIIAKGLLSDFQEFLNRIGIDYKLVEGEVDNKKIILCDFGKKNVNFYSIASKGTITFALFFYWLHQLDEVSLVFIDEFDAFYHNELAKAVVLEVKKRKVQAIITTHNTSIMTTELTRPDCLFNLIDNKIAPFSSLTQKELRKAHNIEKMYKAGSFGV